MNEKIKIIFEKAGGFVSLAYEHDGQMILSSEATIDKFVDLIRQELYNNIVSWMTTPEQIADEPDIAVKQWLEGYDQGIIDALCEVKIFGSTYLDHE